MTYHDARRADLIRNRVGDDRLPANIVDEALAQDGSDRWFAYEQERLDDCVETAQKGQLRWRSESLLPYALTGTGLHLTSCHVIQNLVAKCDQTADFPPTLNWDYTDPMDGFLYQYPRGLDEAGARSVGRRYRRCQLCAPGIPTPPPAPPRKRRSGLGWPTRDGKCAKYDNDR